MARNKGTFIFAANFQVKAAEALDPRVVVSTKSELIVKDTWPHDGGDPYLYNGLLVGVVDEQAVYMLVDKSKALNTNYEGWLRIDAGNAKQIEIVDNLTSDAADKALSAKQGKLLKSSITSIEEKLTSVYSIKGSVQNFEDLPNTDNSRGDVYNVVSKVSGQKIKVDDITDYDYPEAELTGNTYTIEDVQYYEFKGDYYLSYLSPIDPDKLKEGDIVYAADTNPYDGEIVLLEELTVASVTGYGSSYPAGTNFVWNGEKWDALGGSLDLSNYYNKQEVDAAIKVETDRASQAEWNIGQKLSGVEVVANTAKTTADQNRESLTSLSKTVGDLNLTLNGSDTTSDPGLIQRIEDIEDLIGEPADEDKQSTMLSRLNALEELVTGGDTGEGEGDQTLLQKVKQNTLDITALETTVYGADGNSGLVKDIDTINGDNSTVGSMDYKIEQAFKWNEVE